MTMMISVAIVLFGFLLVLKQSLYFYEIIAPFATPSGACAGNTAMLPHRPECAIRMPANFFSKTSPPRVNHACNHFAEW
jgi:hypothetical protein